MMEDGVPDAWDMALWRCLGQSLDLELDRLHVKVLVTVSSSHIRFKE